MTLEGVLRTREGAVRAPWRIAVFLAAAVAGLVVAQSLAYPVLATTAWALDVRLSLQTTLWCVALLLAHVAALRWLDGRPWQAVALGREALRPPALVDGTLAGALAIGVPVLLLVAFGWMRLTSAPDGSSLALALRLAAFLAPAALAEELAMRGYLLTALGDGMGMKAAVLATSVAFALLHVGNPGATPRSIVLVALAGVFLAAVRLRTASLWAAWLAHLAWNWTMAALFHAPVSGLAMTITDYRLTDVGPDWATGGTWGPEGGLFAGLGMLGATLYFTRYHARPAVPAAARPTTRDDRA